MTVITVLCAFLLSWSLGKNNLSNLFGTAIGTKMLQLKTAAFMAGCFIVLGALISSAGTTSSISKISKIESKADLMIVLLSAILVLEYLSRIGIPASIVQTIIGSLIGWTLYSKADVDLPLLKSMGIAWVEAPVIASLIVFILMKLTRFLLYHYPISLLIRDSLLRTGLIIIGIWASYTLGANNISTILAPYMYLFPTLNISLMAFLISGSIAVGCFTANRDVISTVGKKLFPLSPIEALIVMLGTVISMNLFSIQALRSFLNNLHLPVFPLVPIPMSIVIIGAICGISLSKGGKGLRFSVLSHIILSWFWVPVLTGALSYSFLILLNGLI